MRARRPRVRDSHARESRADAARQTTNRRLPEDRETGATGECTGPGRRGDRRCPDVSLNHRLARADRAPWLVPDEGSGDGRVGHPGLAQLGRARDAHQEMTGRSQTGDPMDATRAIRETLAAE